MEPLEIEPEGAAEGVPGGFGWEVRAPLSFPVCFLPVLPSPVLLHSHLARCVDGPSQVTFQPGLEAGTGKGSEARVPRGLEGAGACRGSLEEIASFLSC